MKQVIVTFFKGRRVLGNPIIQVDEKEDKKEMLKDAVDVAIARHGEKYHEHTNIGTLIYS